MVAQITGFQYKINTGRDQPCMQKYLSCFSKFCLDKLDLLRSWVFLPVKAPLLDYIIVDLKKIDDWKYPKVEELEYFQTN